MQVTSAVYIQRALLTTEASQFLDKPRDSSGSIWLVCQR